MTKDPRIFLRDMATALQKAEGYVQGMTWEEFQQDEKTQDAVIRQLAILGEAANKVGKEMQRELGHLP